LSEKVCFPTSPSFRRLVELFLPPFPRTSFSLACSLLPLYPPPPNSTVCSFFVLLRSDWFSLPKNRTRLSPSTPFLFFFSRCQKTQGHAYLKPFRGFDFPGSFRCLGLFHCAKLPTVSLRLELEVAPQIHPFRIAVCPTHSPTHEYCRSPFFTLLPLAGEINQWCQGPFPFLCHSPRWPVSAVSPPPLTHPFPLAPLSHLSFSVRRLGLVFNLPADHVASPFNLFL